jgi:hypothetical protein
MLAAGLNPGVSPSCMTIPMSSKLEVGPHPFTRRWQAPHGRSCRRCLLAGVRDRLATGAEDMRESSRSNLLRVDLHRGPAARDSVSSSTIVEPRTFRGRLRLKYGHPVSTSDVGIEQRLFERLVLNLWIRTFLPS